MIDPLPGIAWKAVHPELVASSQRRAAELVAGLTAAELALLSHLAAGLGNKDIQIAMNASEETIIELRRKLFDSVKAKTIADAVRIASYAGLY